MRPVRLTLQAFGPFPGRVVIDFRNAVEAGLFGIYGQTGSGKSTIFSAMTFALFGEPAKAEQEPASLRSDHAEPDIATEVEFVFDLGGRRHVVLRRPDQMRPKARGEGETRSPHEAFLFDATGRAPQDITETARGRIVAEKKVRDVDAAITAILGYGGEQFRQIVLLPQGRFERFLSAKTRERLDILRELFDISVYQRLMADLKLQADAAEKRVRTERELCARALEKEGFESAEALEAGIVAATLKLDDMRGAEDAAKIAAQKTAQDLQGAEVLAERFAASQNAQRALAALDLQKPEIDRLAERVRQTARAHPLTAFQTRVTETADDTTKAQGRLDEAVTAHERARTKAEQAATALANEDARSAETEALRNHRDQLQRFAQLLQDAAANEQAVNDAKKAQHAAAGELQAAQDRLANARATREKQAEVLKAARVTEADRVRLTGERMALAQKHKAAATYEGAQEAARLARADAERQRSLCEAAIEREAAARQAFEHAEQELAEAQALHLATKLAPGMPCPVCGATDHLAPATGAIGDNGRDTAFRAARSDWQAADEALRKASERLAALLATLTERQQRLAALESPGMTAAALAQSLSETGHALGALGAVIDIAAGEAAIEKLEREITTLDTARDGLRDRVESLRNAVTQAIATRESRLAEVPPDLRSATALDAALRDVTRAHNDRVTARAACEKAVQETREAAIGAGKDHDNAQARLAEAHQQHRAAQAAFAAQLAQAGLTDSDFVALTPFIATLEADRATIETFRQNLKSAADAAQFAAQAIAGIDPPDLDAFRSAQKNAAEALGKATEERAAALGRVNHLVRLREDLDQTLRKIEEDEAASGPLRNLAALVNGANPAKLTLETFAIGAMFDQVLAAANLRLEPMTVGRYTLERDVIGAERGSRGLGIQVFDTHTGKARATSTLSGGETFIAALALALGLADIVESANGKVRLDTIFIDEGFGSLDTENGSGTLDQVLRALNALVSQSRAVGLISHVPLVQEAIPNGFYVRKAASGSTVEERGLT